MNNKDKFDFSYAAPSEQERREIESIKRQYMPALKKEDKLEELRILNRKVVQPPSLLSLTIGILGTLIMGIGMTMALEWELMIWGILVGVIGVSIAAISYPVYRAVLRRNKSKYGHKIIELSNELLNTSDE